MISTCENKAAYRYTWPSKDESVICLAHSFKLRGVAEKIGLHLQLIKLDDDGRICNQEVTGVPCGNCDGCGLVANDDERTPWTHWAALEPPANLAVQMGMIRPEECEVCGGEGRVNG
ncbi:MAG: hypothetical protein L0229_22450 [Blastocatellia bacterium]|nr:hypothetical protein [Blastocatellia bacterium]